nr:CoA transferase [Pseudosulfitobacter pseudonitzschiae]
MSTAPLAGMKILSLAEQFPVLMQQAARGHGRRGHHGRKAGYRRSGPAVSTLFRALNRGKRSVALDLKSTEGMAQFHDLAKGADVIVEGFRPGKLAALGAGFEDMARDQSAPRLRVDLGIRAGWSLSRRAGHDLSYEGVGGLLADQADAGQPGPLPTFHLRMSARRCSRPLRFCRRSFPASAGGRGGTWTSRCRTQGSPCSPASFQPRMHAVGRIHLRPAYGVFTCKDGKLMTLSIAHEDWFGSRSAM